jgi:hypothetical protein
MDIVLYSLFGVFNVLVGVNFLAQSMLYNTHRKSHFRFLIENVGGTVKKGKCRVPFAKWIRYVYDPTDSEAREIANLKRLVRGTYLAIALSLIGLFMFAIVAGNSQA